MITGLMGPVDRQRLSIAQETNAQHVLEPDRRATIALVDWKSPLRERLAWRTRLRRSRLRRTILELLASPGLNLSPSGRYPIVDIKSADEQYAGRD